ncbi:MAG: beta-ketoacyl synthase N-terminal-like domain-containing protein, partial [Acidaminococcaceae bacterium]
MKNVMIISAARTPQGKIGGTLKNVLPEQLLKTVFAGALARAGIDFKEIDEVIAGQAKQSTDAPNIARVASLAVGIPESVPAYTVHRQCASGMQAMYNAAQQIMCGESDVVLTGGVESMS